MDWAFLKVRETNGPGHGREAKHQCRLPPRQRFGRRRSVLRPGENKAAAAVKQQPSRFAASSGLLGRLRLLVDDAFRHLRQGSVGILLLFQGLFEQPDGII